MDYDPCEGTSSAEGGKDATTAYERRREQVRRAQRIHRDRKAAYVSALEREVEALRKEKEAFRAGLWPNFPMHTSLIADKLADQDAGENLKVKALEREVAQLRAERAERLADHETIEKLKSLLESHGVDLPAEFRYHHDKDQMAIAEISGDGQSNRCLQLSLPNANTITSADQQMLYNATLMGPCTSGGSFNATTEPGMTTTNSHSTSDYTIPNSPNLVCEDGTGGTQTGINFILALERICLQHHKLTTPELLIYEQLGTGHAQMLSSPAMACVPPASTDHRDIPLQSGCRWNVPAIELENLLSLSQLLQLDGEVTPIEIWQRVHQHPQFRELTHQTLDRLKEELLPHVMCYGFGAVVAETIVDEAWKTNLEH